MSRHEITAGGTKVADTTLFPPTVMLQYHFDMGKIKPYVGAGVNYTVFFDNTNGSEAQQRLGRGCAGWRGLPAHGQLVRQRRLQEALARH